MSDTAAAPRKSVLRGMAFIAISGLLFCLLNTIARRLTHELDPFQVQFLRYLRGVVVMLPFMQRCCNWQAPCLKGLLLTS